MRGKCNPVSLTNLNKIYASHMLLATTRDADILILRYIEDSNAAAHSGDSDIFHAHIHFVIIIFKFYSQEGMPATNKG